MFSLSRRARSFLLHDSGELAWGAAAQGVMENADAPSSTKRDAALARQSEAQRRASVLDCDLTGRAEEGDLRRLFQLVSLGRRRRLRRAHLLPNRMGVAVVGVHGKEPPALAGVIPVIVSAALMAPDFPSALRRFSGSGKHEASTKRFTQSIRAWA
jgi:hypothetical protein